MKRALDLAIALVLQFFLTPLMLFLYILIKLDSPGPAIYEQKRIGKDENIFKIYKFRTMYIDTPEVATDLLTDRDRYITKVGKFLRRASLDELPQLINIIKGDMSFVGPRPALYNQYDLIAKRRAKGIDKLAPGITGLAQINGRDNISDDQKVEYDEKYLLKKSVFFDLQIVLRTINNVFTGRDVVG